MQCVVHRKNVSINESQKMKESIKDYSKEADDSVIFTLDHNSHAMVMKKGDRYGDVQILDFSESSEK